MLAISSQPMLPLFLAFGLAVIVGAGNYLLVRLADDKMPHLVEGVGFLCALFIFLLVVFVLFLSFLLVLLLPLSLLFLLDFVGAYADRASSREQYIFGWHYWRLFIAQMTSLVSALMLYVFLGWVSGAGPVAFGVMNGPLFFAGWLVGLVAGPIVAPIFIWLWRSSQLRPGIERPLNSSEELSRRS